MEKNEYKQISVTLTTAKKIEELKKKFTEKGTPMKGPSIVGIAINELSDRMN